MSCCDTENAVLSERQRMQVRYLGGRPIVVTGPVTKQEYPFSGSQPLQSVDPRDAAAFARVRGFRLEGVVTLKSDLSSEQESNHG